MNESTLFVLKAKLMYKVIVAADQFCRVYSNSTCRYWELERSIYDCVSRFPEFKKPENR